jgi:hypothetical protein
MASDPTQQALDDPAAWAALAELYHRYLTGLLLAVVVRVGTPEAAEVVFRTFRRQHLDAFLPGLEKLGLTDRPPAVACAQYHVLSNALGGVRVEWLPESDTKSWVRYLPPRWIFDGTAVCGIPTEVSRAMLRGWHGHNGVTLGNDRLGFVCTRQTTDGQTGLEGYYVEEDRPLTEDERVRFRPDESPPNPPAPLALPSWEPVRLAKVERNYAATYIRTVLPVMAQVLGPATAGAVGSIAGRQIGLQYHQAVVGLLGDGDGAGRESRSGGGPAVGPEPFAGRLARLLRGHGGSAAVTPTGGGWTVRCADARMFPARSAPSVFDSWNGLWQGLADMEGTQLRVVARRDRGDPADEWLVRSPPG